MISYKYNGYELNNGSYFYVPAEGLSLDDNNPVDTSFIYRPGGAAPVQAGSIAKEWTFTLNLHIVPQSTDAGKVAVVAALHKIFQTKDTGFYRLERKRPGESGYKYLTVKPTSVNVDTYNFRASVTFVTADSDWRSNTVYTASQLLFDAGLPYETLTVTYNGNVPTYPVLKLTPKTASTSSPMPLYVRQVYVFAHGGRADDTPIRLTSGWDTSALVSAGKMRSDGLDITVSYLPQSGFSYNVPRYVAGSAASRSIWVKPKALQENKPAYTLKYFNAGDSTNAVTATDTQFYAVVPSTGNRPFTLYQNGYIKIDNEIIRYLDVDVLKLENTIDSYKITFKSCVRGQLGTTAATHLPDVPVLLQHIFNISYGYSTGYEYVQANDLTGWPNIDFSTSSNSLFNQSTTHIDGRTYNWDIIPGWALKVRNKAVNAEVTSNDVVFNVYAATGDGTTSSRAVYILPPMTARRITAVNITFTTTTISGITLNVYEVYSNLGRQSSETRKLLYTTTPSSSNSFSTGKLTLKYPITETTSQSGQVAATAIVVELAGATTAADYVAALKIDSCVFYVDETTNRCVDTYFTTTEMGPGTSQYNLAIAVRNQSDSKQTADFSLTKPLVSTNQLITISTEYKTVSGGASLSHVSYKEPIWLRLVPGINNIYFSSNVGTGQVLAELEWEERH